MMESSANTVPVANPPLVAPRSSAGVLRDYLALTKPRIIGLLLVTTVTTMFVADPAGPSLATILWTMLGGYLAAGGAGAINHYLDRERDAQMTRTRGRPLVEGRIEPSRALAFGIILGAVATVQLALTVNALAAALSLVGLLGYVFVYTIWLKPLTPQNIVIGGAAGAMPPLVGWAAATGGLSADALYPFGIVFLWTPPHFWALALLIKDDYARTCVPMLPVVRGDVATTHQIVVYSVLMRPSPCCPRSPACSARSTSPPPSSLASPSWASPSGWRSAPRARRRCTFTSTRCSTWRSSSRPWPRTAFSDRRPPHGSQARTAQPEGRPPGRGPGAGRLRPRLLHRGHLHRLR